MNTAYNSWPNGPARDPGYFPIGVWYQDAKNARAYAELGINVYMAMHGDLTEQLALLRAAGLRAIVGQNERSLLHRDDRTIMAWMHGDEPDNAQEMKGGGWGPALPTRKIVADYRKIRRRDPSRPVLLNIGQGVANDEWIGIGCTIDAYPEYIKGCDIVSFDVYPVASEQYLRFDDHLGEDYLWYVAKGVERLHRWSRGKKLVWNIIECTRISNLDRLATPEQVKAMAWMSLVHGSRSITYFCHQFKPTFNDAALLADPVMSSAVKALNHQIHALAPVLNSPRLPDTAAQITSTHPDVPIDALVKEYDGATYLFAVGMRNHPTRGLFRITELRKAKANARVEVLGENRTLEAPEGRFEDEFAPYGVHLYRITPAQ